jgi:DNA repair protein RecN (Recombination protein N)
MLKQLNIQNLAIAENISVQFQKGLNVITGETGAGKSLLVDAMCLLRGCRVDTSLIRTGHESAQVTGIFTPNRNDSLIFSMLEELGISQYADDPDEIVIKRFIQRNGKHRATVNENLVSSKTLQVISGELIDISSQFENQRLLDSETHTSFLDEFAGNSSTYKNFLTNFNQAQDQLKQLKQIITEQDLIRREKKLYEFELSQISAANISKNEFKSLEEIISLGNKSSLSKRICSEISMNLCNNEINCLDLLKYSRKNIERLVKISGQSEIPVNIEHIDGIISLIEELIDNIDLTSSKFDIDESILNQATQRIEVYNKMLLKFGPTIDDIGNYKIKCEEYLSKAEDLDEEMNKIVKKTECSMKNSILLSQELRKSRNEKLTYISKSIQKELSELGMPKAEFICELKFNSSIIDQIKINEFSQDKICQSTLKSFYSLSKTGSEKAQFQLSTNLGIEVQPIEKVASGGELSRVMLAIKNVLFGEETMSVFVFDEIDTGISGNIAAKVGRKLSEFCKNSDGQITRQALCITHLAQVACFAQNHFIVSKELKGHRTVTKIVQANNDEKLNEIAILLSGEEISQESLAQAKVLVTEAQKEFH